MTKPHRILPKVIVQMMVILKVIKAAFVFVSFKIKFRSNPTMMRVHLFLANNMIRISVMYCTYCKICTSMGVS